MARRHGARRLSGAQPSSFQKLNASDFRPMYAREGIHPGLVVMPAEHGRDTQQQFARSVIEFIIATSAEAKEAPRDFMINKLVEIDHARGCTVRGLSEG